MEQEKINKEVLDKVNGGDALTIDGKEVLDINISNDDIESIEVLKDASSTAVYSETGAN